MQHSLNRRDLLRALSAAGVAAAPGGPLRRIRRASRRKKSRRRSSGWCSGLTAGCSDPRHVSPACSKVLRAASA
jgi:hypothetical protein